ncbi:MAG: YceI family protein [Paludibacter sp.]|nr:YceI family protein [Paludibacter sp.]
MKTKILSLLFFLFMVAFTSAQDKFITKTGHVWFYSHTAIEAIEAHSHQVVAIVIPSTGSIAVGIPIMSFEFKKTLMQEHFNENYMESAKFPKATFKGIIKNPTSINTAKNGSYKTSVEGELTIHGVTKKIKADGVVVVKDGKFNVKSKFIVSPKEYNIAIESRLAGNIAENIDINVDLDF